MEERTDKKTSRPALIAAAIALVLVLVGGAYLWRLTREPPRVEPLPEDPAARAALFQKYLRENPLPTDSSSRKPVREEWQRWLAARGATGGEAPDAEAPSEEGLADPNTPPPVVDLGTAVLPADEDGNSPPRIEPNEFLDEEDLRHPEIFFEIAEMQPEYATLEVRLDVHRFFQDYRAQLTVDLQLLRQQNADPERIRELAAAVARYDDAIERMEVLIEGQRK